MTPSENRILPVCYSNPYAPPWRLPNFEAPMVNLRWTYAKTFTIPVGSTVYNQAIPINGNADFWCRAFGFDIAASTPGTLRVRFKDGDGKRLSADLLCVEELEGPCIITQPFKRGTNVFCDIENLSTIIAGRLQIQLKGINIYEPLGINTCMPGFEPESYMPLYQMYSTPPPGWHDEPFEYYFEIPATASQNQQGLPLKMDSDADFLARGIVGYTGTGTGLQKFRFVDAWQNQLSQDYVFQANEFGRPPLARPIFPEILCPKDSVLTVDAIEYTANSATANFAFRGVKRFRD